MKIGIIGFGNFGQFLAKKFVKYGEVIAYSRSDYINIANNMNVKYFNDLNKMLIEEPDILILSVSIIAFDSIIKKIVQKDNFKYIHNKLIIDVLSVKEYPIEIINKYINIEKYNIDILATHPMFGPDSGNGPNGWKDLPFVYDKIRIKNEDRCRQFLNIFKNEGCKNIEMSCEEHDEYTAKSQFLTHFTGRLLNNLDLTQTPINTNGYSKLLDIIDNTCNDSEDLFLGIFKYNRKSKKWLEKYKESLVKTENFLHI